MIRRFQKRHHSLLIAVAASVVLTVPNVRAEGNFGREILPILSDECFQCHEPDAKARKTNLLFDTREGACRLRKGRSVIVAGDSAASELIRRIRKEDDKSASD
ncbi:MAG TPA: c-type cytochrome domain-containing protein [Gemmataceae bacterium]|jgi:hypothetical protein